MINKILIILFLLNNLTSSSQEWFENLYHVTTDKSIKDNYKDIWLGRTFQGIIGRKFQRIEVRFLTIQKSSKNPYLYQVTGKSKVNKNICDFKGEFTIEKIQTLKDSTAYGDAAEISKGMLWGKYDLKENPSQNHVGTFTGEFYVKFDMSKDGKASAFSDLYYDDENLIFQGNWKDYNSNQPKLCNWGWNIPPEQHSELFSRYENGYYLINPAYFERGWKSYALAKSWIIIPTDYYTNEARFDKDFHEYEKVSIQQSKEKEANEWWK